MKVRQPAVYILANRPNGTIYTGATSDLITRIYQHKQGNIEGFTKRCDCKRLVYYEVYGDIYSAIAREKQLKAGNRKKKLMLITQINPQWLDFYETLL
jgi:putative endonuclease